MKLKAFFIIFERPSLTQMINFFLKGESLTLKVADTALIISSWQYPSSAKIDF